MNYLSSFFFIFNLCLTAFSAQAQVFDLKGRVDDYIRPYFETRNFNGTVLVLQKGAILYERSFGYTNEELNVLNKSGTVYQIASVSKIFTAAAILILEQKGALKTGDVLTKHIPDYPSGSKITIHHLLTHTSGVPNINDMPEYNAASKSAQTPESLITIFKTKALEFEPGEKYKYSNSNYNLLAFIIEKVSGMSYGEFLNKEIFQPAGMNQTGHRARANDLIPDLAVGHQSDGKFGLEKSDYLDWSSKVGNGSLYTTVHDLLAWDRALANNKILSETSLVKMYTNHKANTGYGCFVKEHLKRKRYYMNGRSPGFTSYFSRYPDEEVCIVVLANNYIPVATQMGMDIAAILFNEKYELLNLSAKPVDPLILKKIVGVYQFDKDFYRPNFKMSVTEKNGYVSIDWGELIPTGEFNFIARAFWSDVSFDRDARGNVTAIDYDGYKGKRIE